MVHSTELLLLRLKTQNGLGVQILSPALQIDELFKSLPLCYFLSLPRCMLGEVSGNKLTLNLSILKSNFTAFTVPKVTVSKSNLFSPHFFFKNPSFPSCLTIHVGGGRVSFQLALPMHCFEFLMMAAK